MDGEVWLLELLDVDGPLTEDGCTGRGRRGSISLHSVAKSNELLKRKRSKLRVWLFGSSQTDLSNPVNGTKVAN